MRARAILGNVGTRGRDSAYELSATSPAQPDKLGK